MAEMSLSDECDSGKGGQMDDDEKWSKLKIWVFFEFALEKLFFPLDCVLGFRWSSEFKGC